MNKKMLVTGALVVGATQLVGCGSDSDPLTIFQKNAPADTIMYAQGKHVAGTSGMYDLDKIQSALYRLLMMDGIHQDNEAKKTFRSLLDKLTTLSEQDADNALKSFGLKDGYASAFYLDGIAPVLQFELENDEQFIKGVQDLVSDTESLKFEEQTIGGKKVQVLPFKSKDENTESSTSKGPQQLFLAVRAEEGIGTITIFTDKDADEQKEQRLAIIEEPKPLSDTDRIESLEKKYNFTENMVGFVDLVQLATSVVKPETTRAGKDFLAWDGPNSSQGLPPVCADETISLVKNVPELVVGYTQLESNGSKLKMDSTMILKIENQKVRDELKKLNGHLDSSMLNSNAIIAMGLGLDMDQLVPSLTNLWTQFTGATFECPALQQAQMQAQQANPAMLGMFTSFAAGVQGVSFELFDVNFNEEGEPSDADFIITAATKQPNQLVGLTAMAGMPLQLPADGSAISLPLPPNAQLPEGVDVKAAMKEKEVVLFMGKKATEVFEGKNNDALNHDGIMNGMFNYNKLFDLASKGAQLIGAAKYSDSYECATAREAVMMWDSAVDYANYDMRFNDEGLVIKSAGQVSSREAAAFKPGKYQVEYLSDGCEWVVEGKEELKEDGTGSYSSLSDDQSCALTEVAYTWTKTGPMIEFKDDSVQYREQCSDELVDDEKSEYSCLILSTNEKGFECLYGVEEGEGELYRFTRQ
jgi:hypothetical protein